MGGSSKSLIVCFPNVQILTTAVGHIGLKAVSRLQRLNKKLTFPTVESS